MGTIKVNKLKETLHFYTFTKMDKLNTRLSNLENVISNLVSSMKKIEEVKKKDDLYNFTNQQLMKWLKDNQVNYNENIKDTLVDIVWKNINEWEWEYYYEDEEEHPEPEKEESVSDLTDDSDEEK